MAGGSSGGEGSAGVSGGAESGGAESGGAESGGAESGGAESGGAESGGAESGGAESGGSSGVSTGGTGGVGTGGVSTGGTGGTACGRKPITAFDATPAGTCGSVCTAANAVVSDGAWAGLDCTGGGSALIDNVAVTACVAADFGAVVNLDPVIISARSIGKACGTGCSTGCNTGDEMLIFYGSERGLYQFATTVPLLASFKDYPVMLGLGARFVLVCRDGGGPFRDDIVVDSIRSGHGC